MKKKLFTGLAIGLFLCGSVVAVNAASFTFDGNIAYHNDVIEIGFTLNNDATNVSVWTDSFMNAINFDPITALWTSTGALIGQNDDNPYIATGQTYYDSGLSFGTLAAGDYLFTIATYANWAVSSTLSDGFQYDAQTPILMANWDQPASHLGMGTYYRVNLDGVDDATNNTAPVPEPSTILLMGAGLLGLVGYNRRRFSKKS